MNNSYVIPAHSKKSALIFGHFNTVDLIIFGCGIGISFLLMMFLPVEEFAIAAIAIAPGLLCTFLILPVPNYHNVRTVIKNIWIFYTTRQKYIWKGWCLDKDESEKK